ncbi:enoyl-CoA hydratase/isomerase family protein [Brevibacillus sp. NRS-1366]|uniref:enoyl-CoA hydratase/isomerase family protein n=1 Tax=Brevibacillus sp. NRS-1366 TaxID=3233899 RepID=UPI003D1E1364
MTNKFEFLLMKTEDQITTITLNRPDKLNALNTGMMLELREAFTFAKEDHETKVVILNAAGKSFCSGADISEFKSDSNGSDAIRERGALSMEVYSMLHKIGKPVISSVQGYVLAGGCGLAMTGDLVIAADDAVFSYPEIQRGFVAALVMTNLTRLVGRRNAFDLLITGRRVHADEALKMGLVNLVVPREQLDESTIAMAKKIAGHSLGALQMTKNLFYRVTEMNAHDAMETSRDTNAMMRSTGDFTKGVNDFISKKEA